MVFAMTVRGSVFERFLSPDRPGDRAIIGYLELVKSGRASSMDLANLGVLILEKGFPGDAEDYLLAALKLDKHNYEAAYRLGLVLQREGRDREAVRYYKMTVKQRPGYAQALFMLALAEERCGRREDAIHDFAKAYRHAPELANPKKNPLVYDSNLQTEAILRHYEEEVRTTTFKVTEIDPAAIQRMMDIKPQPDRGEGGNRPRQRFRRPPNTGRPAGRERSPGASRPRRNHRPPRGFEPCARRVGGSVSGRGRGKARERRGSRLRRPHRGFARPHLRMGARDPLCNPARPRPRRRRNPIPPSRRRRRSPAPTNRRRRRNPAPTNPRRRRHLHVEPEGDHVAVSDHVVLALEAQRAARSAGGERNRLRGVHPTAPPRPG